MSFDFARRMEREAELIAGGFKNEIDGIKPWYSYAGLFHEQVTRVFVGLNPGGSSRSKHLDKRYRSLERVYEEPEYNSWLDEVWEGASSPGSSVVQERAKRAFRVMYGGENWERVLRDTTCLNVIPFRTSSAAKLPSGAWDVAQPWFKRVMKHLKPKLIICDGSGESKSSWAAVKEFNTIDSCEPIPTANRGQIKYGRVVSGPMKGADVVALPHLSKTYFWPDSAFQKLRELRESWPGLV